MNCLWQLHIAASGEGWGREGSLATSSFHTQASPSPTLTLWTSDALVPLPGNLLPLCSASRPLALREGSGCGNWLRPALAPSSLVTGKGNTFSLTLLNRVVEFLMVFTGKKKGKMKPTRRIPVQQSQAKSSVAELEGCSLRLPVTYFHHS